MLSWLVFCPPVLCFSLLMRHQLGQPSGGSFVREDFFFPAFKLFPYLVLKDLLNDTSFCMSLFIQLRALWASLYKVFHQSWEAFDHYFLKEIFYSFFSYATMTHALNYFIVSHHCLRVFIFLHSFFSLFFSLYNWGKAIVSVCPNGVGSAICYGKSVETKEVKGRKELYWRGSQCGSMDRSAVTLTYLQSP